MRDRWLLFLRMVADVAKRTQAIFPRHATAFSTLSFHSARMVLLFADLDILCNGTHGSMSRGSAGSFG